MELKIYNVKGEETGRTVVIDDAIVGVEPNDHAIWLDVKHYLAAQRQGTHKSKERSELSGSTRKLKKQKGTGGARAGDINSPLMRGGARVFGPRPRDYSFKLNKKVKQLARFSALAYKAKEGKIMVVENFSFDQPKTKNMIALMEDLKLKGRRSLFILEGENNRGVVLSARNLQNVLVTNLAGLNTYRVLNASDLVLTEDVVAKMNEKVLQS